MKRNLDEDEAKLSTLLFNKANNFVDKLKTKEVTVGEQGRFELESKPAWIDEDEEDFRADIIPNTKNTCTYTEKLKQKYEALIGTPGWAKLKKKKRFEDDDGMKLEDEDSTMFKDDDSILMRSVGHLQKKASTHLPKDYLLINRFPQINAQTQREGPIITCIEFHPKMSVSMVAGHSGIVSLFSIGGDVNNKLHAFKLKNFKVSAAHFSPDGNKAFVASKLSHNYCIYDLIKAKPKLVQLPKVVKRPTVFEMSPDGHYIATAIGYDEVYIISADSCELLKSLKHSNKVESVVFSHDSKKLYSYTIQGEVVIWDLSTFRAVQKFYDHGCVTASTISNSPCGRLLATGSGEGIVNIYETSNLTTREPTPLKTISNLTTRITNLKFNATSEILALSSGYLPNAVKLVHIPSYHVFLNFPKAQSNVYQVEVVNFSPNSGFMALGNNKGKAFLYRLKHYKNY